APGVDSVAGTISTRRRRRAGVVDRARRGQLSQFVGRDAGHRGFVVHRGEGAFAVAKLGGGSARWKAHRVALEFHRVLQVPSDYFGAFRTAGAVADGDYEHRLLPPSATALRDQAPRGHVWIDPARRRRPRFLPSGQARGGGAHAGRIAGTALGRAILSV